MTQLDPFSKYLRGWDAPATHAEEADFSGGDHEFSAVTRAIAVAPSTSNAGSLVIAMLGEGGDITLPIDSFQWLPIRATHVRDESSDVTVVGFW